MRILGIDVGITGSVSAICDDGAFEGVWDLPVMMVGKTKWIDAMGLLGILREARDGSEAVAVIEHIHATPKMGCTTGHSLGLTLGSVLAVVQMAGIPLELVTPVEWKRGLNLLMPGASDREKKHASLCKARMLFPSAPLDRQKDNGRAEALLIGHWYLRTRAQKMAA